MNKQDSHHSQRSIIENIGGKPRTWLTTIEMGQETHNSYISL